VQIYAVNPQTGDDIFNLSGLPIGSAFTVEFYIGNVTDMITWQIRVGYNHTQINYDKAWIPEDNVFKQATDQGAIPTKGIAVNADNATDIADLLIIMTCTYPPDSQPKHPVTVTSKALLCKVNFTIGPNPPNSEITFITQPQDYPGLYITPHYYLPNLTTSIETINGTYPGNGEPAYIYDPNPLLETSTLLFLVWIPTTLALILTRRRTKTRNQNR
jgi:hypothetical protein